MLLLYCLIQLQVQLITNQFTSITIGEAWNNLEDLDSFSIVVNIQATYKFQYYVYLLDYSCDGICQIDNGKENQNSIQILDNDNLILKNQISNNNFTQSFSITNLIFPISNKPMNYSISIQQSNEPLYFYGNVEKLLAKQLINTMSLSNQQTSAPNTLTISYNSLRKNHLYDVIVVTFPTDFNLSFNNCKGIQNINQNLNCIQKDNLIQITQNEVNFNENSNHGQVIFQINGFKNLYYIGQITIYVYLKVNSELDSPYYFNYFLNQISTISVGQSDLIISQQSQLILEQFDISISFNVQTFNQYLQLMLYIYKFNQSTLEFQISDLNIQFEVKQLSDISYLFNFSTSQPLYDYNITLIIQNYQNPSIPQNSTITYNLFELTNDNETVFSIQKGKGILQFLANTLFIDQIQQLTTTITQANTITINFHSQIVIPNFSILIIKLNDKFNLDENSRMFNNTMYFDNIFDGFQTEFSVQIENIINPTLPCEVEFYDISVLYNNYQLCANSEIYTLQYISGVIQINYFQLDNLLNNQYGNLNLELQFELQLETDSDLILQFTDINFDFENNLQLECYCNLNLINCALEQNILTLYNFKVMFQNYQLQIKYFPYPTNIAPFIIQSIQQQFTVTQDIIQSTNQSYSLYPQNTRLFNSVIVTNQDNLNLNYNPYLNLTIIPSITIKQGDYLLLSLQESQFINSQCSLSIKYQIKLICQQYNNNLLIFIQEGNMIKNEKYSIIVSNILIQQQIVLIKLQSFNQNNYLSQQSELVILLNQNIQQDSFPYFVFEPNTEDLYYGHSISYSLIFYNNIIIPKDGYIKLISQGNIDILSCLNDQEENIIVTEIRKYINSSQSIIQLYFQEQINIGLHKINLLNITNPFYFQNSSSYLFELYSYSFSQELIEYGTYDLTLSFKCNTNYCQQCLTSDICDICTDGYVNQQGMCQKNCGQGFQQINQICYQCNTNENCLQCSYNDLSSCILCKSNFILINGLCHTISNVNSTTINNNTNNNNTLQISYQNNLNLLFISYICIILLLCLLVILFLRHIYQQINYIENTILATSGLSILFNCIIIAFLLENNITEKLTMVLTIMCFKIKSQVQIQKLLTEGNLINLIGNQTYFEKIIYYLILYFDGNIVFLKPKIKNINQQKFINLIQQLYFVNCIISIHQLFSFLVVLIQHQEFQQNLIGQIIYQGAILLISIRNLQFQEKMKNEKFNSIMIIQ